MKLKPHSIRFKFFSAISLVALMFIGILLLLNLFFYQDYFMMTRKSSLCDAFDTVCGSYDGDMDDIVTLLDSYESRSAIRLAVAMDDGTVLTSSFLHDRDDHAAPDFEFGMNEQQFRSIAVLASVMQNEDWSSLAEHQYRFANISLRDNDQYLCLIGSLDKDEGRYLIAYMPFAFIEQNSSLNLVFLLIAGGCALLICLGIAFFFSREFTRPLVSMAALADRMSELDFSTQYTGKGRRESDEVEQLGQSLNRLSAYLEQAIGELKESNDQLAQEVREKERIDNMRREFIVNVSHELKTPIALIQGYAEGLTAGVADDPEDRKFYCDTIADEAGHMNRLVMQLLSLSKLELGAEQTFYEEIDLHEMCRDAVQKTAVLCESKNLSVDCADTHITVRTDSGLLEQVLMNYLSNAIRYTAEGGSIVISAVRNGGRTRLTVFNAGEGLPEDELPKIWEKFYRTDRARTREACGTGIGLSLVRAIADTLHGDCGAENVPGGIAFWFDIPDAPPQTE